jgi:hypothetical protein
LKHFPEAARNGVTVLSPVDYLAHLSGYYLAHLSGYESGLK